MPTIDEIKEQAVTPTPLFLFECVLRDGTTERWGTHGATFGGDSYDARVLRHNVFDITASSDAGLDGAAKVSVTLANADSRFSQLARNPGFKGAKVTVRFLFYDLTGQAAASEARVVFQGVGGDADEITESTLRVTFTNRLNLQRIVLPEVRIQRRCPWTFPSNVAQRQEAMDGGSKGKYSALYRCGYSADQAGGEGQLNGGGPFTACRYTRPDCEARGMFALGRFGGVEFVPAQIEVRGHGDAERSLSAILNNEARYNDAVPLAYGTVWYDPPLVFARNDGNLTRMEILLGMGEIEDVLKVVVNDIEVPEGISGTDMTATGWYNVITAGQRSGALDPNFADGAGNPLGDPYGSMAMVSVVVPNGISDGAKAPKIRVLVRGMKLEQFDGGGTSLGESYSSNPAWVLLDVLRRSGWLLSEIDTASFASAASYCDEPVSTTDLYGNSTAIPRYQCNLIVQKRRSAAEVIRGIRAASCLLLSYNADGLLQLRVENTLALQQPVKPEGCNSTTELNGGWPAYEFSDGSDVYSGILRKSDGEPAIRMRARSASDSANRLTVEFQDEFNEYQQDSLSLVDVDDANVTGREVSAAYPALGLPNFDQATRVLDLQLAKLIEGGAFIELETTVRGIGLAPGDLIAVSYVKEGLARQPFRVVRLAPGRNYQTVLITAQWHEDVWYTSGGADAAGGRRRYGSEVGVPRPLVGAVLDADGVDQYSIAENVIPVAGGSVGVTLTVGFVPPSTPGASSANIPRVGLSPTVATTGGTLEGGRSSYYAFSAIDGDGQETDLSFAVRAKVPSGTSTNQVTIDGLSFSSSTTGFHVYRGENPRELLRIAANQPVAASFTDGGLSAELQGPPDPNYDHAVFSWRLELQPEVDVQSHSATTVGNSTLGMLPDNYVGALVRVTRGTGAGQERRITTNDATTVTVSPAWLVEPDTTSFFAIAEGTWRQGGTAVHSPAVIEVLGRPSATVHVSGRSANAYGQESAVELNPLTRWQIGASFGTGDSAPPPEPVYGFTPLGGGTVELAGVSFSDLTNTSTIGSGTLALFSWDELGSPTTFTLTGAISDTDTTIDLSAAGSAVLGTLLQIEAEILEVTAVNGGGTQYEVARGRYNSTAASHAAGADIYHLERDVRVIPFAHGFFGSPASGSFSYPIYLPDVRIGAAEMWVTNSFGNGLSSFVSFGRHGGSGDPDRIGRAGFDPGGRVLGGGEFGGAGGGDGAGACAARYLCDCSGGSERRASRADRAAE